jgi:hypothetical protein
LARIARHTINKTLMKTELEPTEKAMQAVVYQCDRCNRQHDGQGHLLAFRAVVPESRVCGMIECVSVAQSNAEAEAQRVQRRRERFSNRPATSASLPYHARVAPRLPQRAPVPSRLPYSDPEPRETTQSHAPGDLQRAFVSSGASDSANTVLVKFFEQQLKSGGLNKWFIAADLEDMAKDRCMNNRAIDIRPHFVDMGFYIDNTMMPVGGSGRAVSHYRICKIKDAHSLTPEQKLNLIRATAANSP